MTVTANSKIDDTTNDFKPTPVDGKIEQRVPAWAKYVSVVLSPACPDCSIAGEYIGGIAIGKTYNENGAKGDIKGVMVENSPSTVVSIMNAKIPDGVETIYITAGYWKNNVKCNSHNHKVYIKFSESNTLTQAVVLK